MLRFQGYLMGIAFVAYILETNACLGGMNITGGRMCPGDFAGGGDFCPDEYECIPCNTISNDYTLGGLCLQNHDTSIFEDYDYNSICNAMNVESAGRNCGGSWCEMSDYCVDCASYGKSELNGFVCLNGDLSLEQDGFKECQLANGILFRGC